MVSKKARNPRSNLEEQQLRKLMYSVTNNDFKQVNKLVSLGIPNLVNMLDLITKETALHAAVCNGLEEMVSYLLEQGSNISKRDKQGRTPLIRAVDKGNKSILELLIEAGGNPNDQDGAKQHVLFHGLQSTSRHLACIEILLREGADINTTDQNGQTMLVRTVKSGYVDFTETLIQLGADVKIRNEEGESLLFTAAREDHVKLIPILVQAGAPINETGPGGNTPIHICCGDVKKFGMLQLLAGKGLDLHKQNEEGNTPLHIAVQTQNAEAIKFLLARGCPLETTNTEGLTIRNLAVANKDSATKKLLKKQEQKIKKAVTDGKIANPAEFWKMCLYQWVKEHKAVLIDEFFAKDTNQTGLLKSKMFSEVWERYEVPLTVEQKSVILGLHKDGGGLIKYLDFLDANLYLKTAAYDGFARA